MMAVTTWEMKNMTATNIKQYERGMSYLFFVMSETKPVQTEINKGYKDIQKKNENES